MQRFCRTSQHALRHGFIPVTTGVADTLEFRYLNRGVNMSGTSAPNTTKTKSELLLRIFVLFYCITNILEVCVDLM